jgi:hypothetical protein
MEHSGEWWDSLDSAVSCSRSNDVGVQVGFQTQHDDFFTDAKR